jgi:cell wall-associated NlpC family hydrolase
VSSLRTARTQARRSHASALADHANAINARRDLAARLRAVRAATAQYRQLLARLNAAQRQAYLRRDDARTSPKPGAVGKRRAGLPPAPNPAARTAVVYAEAQVGKPYVFGAAGPNAFDCSGLTMMAWRAAGVDLPHLTTLQIRRGHPVSWNDLAPGDLIFLYPGVGHVELYVGAGLAVSAPQPGEYVKYVEIARHRSDFVGAIRLP